MPLTSLLMYLLSTCSSSGTLSKGSRNLLSMSLTLITRRVKFLLSCFERFLIFAQEFRIRNSCQRSEDVRSCPIPGSPKPSYTTSCVNTNLFSRDKVRLTTQNSEAYKTFIGISTGLIPPKIGRGKGAQGTKSTITLKKTTAASKKKRPKKKVSIHDESSDEESNEPEERLIRSKPRGVVIQDTPQVSKKKSTDSSQNLKLKGIELLSDVAHEVAGLGPEIPDEPSKKSADSDEGSGIHHRFWMSQKTKVQIEMILKIGVLSHPAKAETRGVTSWVSSQHNGVNNKKNYNALNKTKMDTKCHDNT
ncbi:hypothetical protein Tco_0536653 [Tanacetum coccineum]